MSNLWYRVPPHSRELVAEVAALSKRGPARVTICSGGFKKDFRGGLVVGGFEEGMSGCLKKVFVSCCNSIGSAEALVKL